MIIAGTFKFTNGTRAIFSEKNNHRSVVLPNPELVEQEGFGTPGKIRTYDLLLRRQTEA